MRDAASEETPDEVLGRLLVERDRFVNLRRAVPCEWPTPDYESDNGRIRVEVKRLTDQAYRDLTAAFPVPAFDSDLLAWRWTVMVQRPTLSDTLASLPQFPADDPDSIESWAAAGFIVKPRSERESEWQAQHPGPKRSVTQLRGLPRDIEAHLATLERSGVTSTRRRRVTDPAVRAAMAAVAGRTANALCVAHEPVHQPGIDVALSSGYVRTGTADTVVDRIALWLGSEHAENLRASLGTDHGVERHAVLIFDSATEPEYQTASELGLRFCPTRVLELPCEVDVLWFVVGQVTCRFDARAGWRSLSTPTT